MVGDTCHIRKVPPVLATNLSPLFGGHKHELLYAMRLYVTTPKPRPRLCAALLNGCTLLNSPVVAHQMGRGPSRRR